MSDYAKFAALLIRARQLDDADEALAIRLNAEDLSLQYQLTIAFVTIETLTELLRQTEKELRYLKE